MEERKDQALLLYCIALEAFLLSNEDKEIAYSFALRGAHLLVEDGTKRKQVYRDLKDLYTTRSKIVHSGKAEILSIELAKAEVLAKSALFTVHTTPPFSEFVTEKQFNDWVEEQTLAGVRTADAPIQQSATDE